LTKKISQIFLFILKPVYNIIFKFFILPLYNILHLTKKKIKKDTEDQTETATTNILISKYSLYLFIALLSFSVIFNNIKIKTAAAEDLGKQSLLYQISQGNEFEEDIIEETFEFDETMHNLIAHSETDKFLELEEMIIGKGESLSNELETKELYSAPEEELIADAILKTGSPSTFTTPQPRSNITNYTIQSGDTISSIAQKFNISINTVLWANNLSGLSVIRPGQKLNILPTTGISHKVSKGDTISAIAKKYGVEQDKILNYNNLVSIDQLSIGQALIVPGGEIKHTYYASRRTPSVSNIFRAPSSQKKSSGFIWPTAATKITQYYHWRHHGLDIGGPTGTPLYASMSGKVTRAGWGTGYGNYVVIDHGNGKKSLYAHMSKIYVKRGQSVKQGVTIGAMGSTGWSTIARIHFESIINGRRMNIGSYL